MFNRLFVWLTKTRWKVVAVIIAVALLIIGAVGFYFAQKTLKAKIVEALGPDSEVQSIQLSWAGVEIIGLRIRPPKAWPAQDALRAERIVVVPDLRSLFSSQYRVSSITIEEPYLSVLRTKDGRLRLIPGLLEKPVRQDASASPSVFIGKIKLKGGVLEFFDATVAHPPWKLRLERMQATVNDLQLPTLKGRTPLQLQGTFKGVNRDGSLSIAGWAEMASKDSSLTTKLSGVDLVSLQPYLIKASETGVHKGVLDLDLKSTVQHNRLHAPGVITLSGLELSSAGGAFGSFMGVPRQAVMAFMKNKNDQITVKFALDCDINDPNFSVNENISTRIASSMAESLGVSLKGVGSGVGTVGQKGLEAVGKAMGKIFGK
ncbi:MAG: DUF748 domain-containing protein [Pseudomonadota bacterium]